MNLQHYLKQHRGQAARDLAQATGTSVGYLREISYGLRRPSAEMALKLERASGGLITARDIRPDLPWPAVPSAAAATAPPQ